MACILVIHGFNSGKGVKSIELEQQFPNHTVLSPQLQNSPLKDLSRLQQIIDENQDVHVVGTSLGGFYAMCLALRNPKRDDVDFYLINPSRTPAYGFAERIGEQVTNYKTQEPFVISQQFVAELGQLQQELDMMTVDDTRNMQFFLSLQDDVLNFDVLRQQLAEFKAPIRIHESEQDHRHQNINAVVAQIKLNMAGYCF